MLHINYTSVKKKLKISLAIQKKKCGTKSRKCVCKKP